MLDKLRKRFNAARNKEPKPGINRNINDIVISVKEGLSGTREIHVSAWTPELAFKYFKDIRNELRENPG